MSRKKCAVVLVVKNEAKDIASWLAWYHVQGFDACIVYDDGSTDDTRLIVERAARVQDVRLAPSTGDKGLYYYLRQEMSFRTALETYAGEFEWLAFFDADEFILFRDGLDVKSFLAGFDDADGIVVNWCNYGSSNHALKPEAMLVEAFTWHGTPNQPINRHVKSIVRPEKVGPLWKNVHGFDVPVGRYLDASHNPFAWSSTVGIVDRLPDWSVAKLMHFQCRSMEHFVERLRKRPELPGSVDLWRHYDINEQEDRLPLKFLPALHEQIRKYDSSAGVIVNDTAVSIQAGTRALTRSDLIAKLWRGRDPFDGFPQHVYEPDMQGWGNTHNFLVDSIETIRPSLIVEVGVWKGASTIAMAGRIRDLGLPGTVIAVDTWLGAWDHWITDEWFEHLGWDHGYPSINRKFMNNVVSMNLQSHVVPLPLDSLNAAQVLKTLGIRPDIIHLDGAHDYDAVIADLKVWWPLLQPGGLLIGDDYYEHTHWPGVKQAFDLFFSPDRPSPLENGHGKCRVWKSVDE